MHYTPITNHTSRKIEANCKATALWWALSPQMAGRDELCGTVFFTGGVDEDGDSRPVPQEIVDLWEDIGE